MRQSMAIIFVVITLLSCDNADHSDAGRERAALLAMVHDVTDHMREMGFPIDVSVVNIDVKSHDDMTATFNRLSDESKQEVKEVTPFGPSKKTERVATARLAFYDPNSKTIVFMRGARNYLTPGYLAHELAHVYQDQKWNFNSIWKPYQENPSRELFNITQFVVEGHAELVRQTYEQKFAKDALTEFSLSASLGNITENDCLICDKNHIPANLPYSVGLRFLLQKHRNGGWPLVEKFFEELPSSSEQIIHPNKHRLDEPTALSLPTWTNDEKNPQLSLNGSLGEAFLLTKLLNMGVKSNVALESASGWDGDIAQLYRTDDGKEALVWRLLFDRVIDAKQLETALRPLTKPSEIFRVGRVVDWIITNNHDLKKELRLFLSKNPTRVESNLSDERTTMEQERSINDDAKILLSP